MRSLGISWKAILHMTSYNPCLTTDLPNPEAHCLCLGELPEFFTSHVCCVCITTHWLTEPKPPNPSLSLCLLISPLSIAKQELDLLSDSFLPRLTSCLRSGMSKAFQSPCPPQNWPTTSRGKPLPTHYTEAGQAVTCSYSRDIWQVSQTTRQRHSFIPAKK